MKKLIGCLLFFFSLNTLSFLRNFEFLGFLFYLPLFFMYEFFDVAKMKRRVVILIFLFSYIHFLILFWWLRHISIYAPVFLALPLGSIRTLSLFIPFMSSPSIRARRLPFYMSAGIIVEKVIISFIYPQPYLQSNLIFVQFDNFFKPVLLFSTLYQNIFLMLISYSIYSVFKSLFFKICLYKIEKINIICIAFILALLSIGRIMPIELHHRCSKVLNVAILQPNIDQYVKNEYRDRSKEILEKVRLQTVDVKRQRRKVDLIIAPETIFPYVVAYKNEAYRFLRKMREKVGADLLLGGFWEDSAGNVFNSAFLVTRTTIYVYKKVQLVVFGEYLPLGNIRFVKKLYDTFLPTKNFETLKSAKKFKVLKYKGLKIQPLICFEGFLESSYRNNKDIDLYINLSNEGWYKDGLELYWGWNITKAMSVFAQTPVIRSTNTGISGVHYYDYYHDRLLKSQPLQERDKLINFDGIYIDTLCIRKGIVTLFDSIVYFATFCYLFFMYIFVIILYVLVLLILLIFLVYRLFLKKN